jgi:MFS family permease
MLPVALAVVRTADCIGRKPILLVGFAVLPIRSLLYTFLDNAFWLIGVQLLDGIGAGIFGAITPLIIADLMSGTGRNSLAQVPWLGPLRERICRAAAYLETLLATLRSQHLSIMRDNGPSRV